MDSDGRRHLYTNEPSITGGEWRPASEDFDFIRTRYHELELPYLRDLIGE